MAYHYVFDERFVEAFAHTGHRVLGMPLRPFSLWHEFNLQLIDSPVLTGEPIELKDLVAAVLICSSRFRSGGPTPELALPRGPRRLAWWWRLWRMQPLTVEVDRFAAYLIDYGSGPQFWPNQHKGGGGQKERDVDELLETAAWIWKQTGCGEDYAWNMPSGSARWYCSVFSKFEGAEVDIWTPIHEQAKKRNDILREWRIKERTAKLVAKYRLEEAVAAELARADYWALVNVTIRGLPLHAKQNENPARTRILEAVIQEQYQKGMSAERARKEGWKVFWVDAQQDFRKQPPKPATGGAQGDTKP